MEELEKRTGMKRAELGLFNVASLLGFIDNSAGDKNESLRRFVRRFQGEPRRFNSE